MNHCDTPHYPGQLLDSRSRLDAAVRSMNDWSNEDRQIFIASFTTKKTERQVARELGINEQALHDRRKAILRRFIYAGSTAINTPVFA